MLLFALSVIGGIILHSNWKTAGLAIFIFACLAGFFPFSIRFRSKIFIQTMIVIVLFIVSSINYSNQYKFREMYMDDLHDSMSVVCEGDIYKIENSDHGVRIYLNDCAVKLKDGKASLCNNIMIYSDQGGYSVKNRLKVYGKVKLFKEAANEGEFDLKKFYQSQKIDFAISAAEIKEYDTDDFLDEVCRKLYAFRDKFKASICDITDERTAGVLNSMIVGDKSLLDTEIKELYQNSGISHILAISGLHVSMIGMTLYKLLRKRGTSFLAGMVVTTIILFSYSFMTGNSVSTQRAVYMCMCFMLAAVIGRKTDMLTSLAFTAIIILMDNPFLLYYSGFVFSFAAIVSIAIVVPAFSPEKNDEHDVKEANTKNHKNKICNKLLSTLWSTAGIQVAMLPIVAFYFYEIPLYSLFINLIVLPLVPFVFAFSILAGVTGLISIFGGKVIVFPAKIIIDLYEIVCEAVKKIPYNQLIVGKPNAAKILYFYLILGIMLCIIKLIKKNVLRRVIKTVACIFLTMLLCYNGKEKFEIDILDVGQGDGTFIQYADGTAVFIDGGSTSKDKIGKYTIIPFLKSKGISEISYWFVSHADEDHINGLYELMEAGYKIDNLAVSQSAAKCDEKTAEITEIARKLNINIIKLFEGDKIRITDEDRIECLYPYKNTVSDNRNDICLTLKVVSGSFSAIFAGDIPTETEQVILANSNIGKTNLFKVNHHGSKGSNSKEWLSTIKPDISVISCAIKNNYGHPADETLLRLENCKTRIFYTMYSGQISIIKDDKENLIINKFLENESAAVR